MTEFDMQKAGERIKKLRHNLWLTQKQLSTKIGVSPNTISQYERGTSQISLQVLVRLAEALDTTTDYILGR